MRLSSESNESITITTRTCTTQNETVKYMSASVGVTVGTRESLTISRMRLIVNECEICESQHTFVGIDLHFLTKVDLRFLLIVDGNTL